MIEVIIFLLMIFLKITTLILVVLI